MSQGMNEFLSAYYGTAPQPTAEEIAHAQQIDFFAKTAASNGIDLQALNQDQINWLWGQVFAKEAEAAQAAPAEQPKTAAVAEKKDDSIAKEAAASKLAEAEFLQKKEAMAKIAEADFLGRVIAHSMYDESEKIAAAKRAEAEKAAEFPPKKDGDGDKDDKKDEKGGESLRDRLMSAASEKKEEKEEKKASVSEFDVKAAQTAVQKIASSQYWNVDEAVDRLNAVLTLGAKESVKVASAPNVEAALDIRSLELLELAGYPIKWEG